MRGENGTSDDGMHTFTFQIICNYIKMADFYVQFLAEFLIKNNSLLYPITILESIGS